MTEKSLGPVGQEMHRRLTVALAPEMLRITDDSESHRGHAGHDGSGESHFTVEVVAGAFAGQGRVARQRLVNAAVGDLVSSGRVHALAIRARAPGE